MGLHKGLDQQGRHPEAAEACTEIGHEDAPNFYGWGYLWQCLWEGAFAALLVAAVFIGIGWMVGAL